MPGSAPAEARGLITAAVTAGLPAGLLYAAANHLLAIPPLLQAEAFEAGGAPAVWTWGRALGGLAGAVALATAFSLILTPVVRALGPPTWRNGLLVGVAAFATLFLLPAVATRPGPPGLEAAAPLATRQAWWLLAALALPAAVGLGLAVRRAAGRARAARALGWGAGLALWAVLAAIYVGATGGSDDLPVAGKMPGETVARFRGAILISNGLLFLGLACLIPPALRRLAP